MRETLLVVLAALVLGATGADSGGYPGATPTESLLLDEINRVRAANGLAALRADPRLGLAARTHSRNVLSTGVLAHGSVARRFRSVGVRSKPIGENLAWSSGARVRARAVVAQWLVSPPHRAVVLGRAFRRVGVGAAAGRFLGFPTAQVVTADFAG